MNHIILVILSVLLPSLRSTSADTTCPAVKKITKRYLRAIKASKTSIFYPSAYFQGSAVKVVSANAFSSMYHPFLCVDGGTRATTFQLYDDGTRGDDVAGDGIYSRACVHFCESVIDYSDFWDYAFHQNFYEADLIVVRSNLQNKIPHRVIQSPKYPKAKIYATSHAAFFVDIQRHYYPNWPVERVWDYQAGARHTAVAAVLDIFGDVFDWFSITPFDFNFRYCRECKSIPGYYNTKFHGWERTGGPAAFRKPGQLSDCDFSVTGFPILRMVGGVSNEDMITEFLGQIHEWLHGAAGYSYQRYLSKAHKDDGVHVPGTCTTDHSQLQGPLWDWKYGYPTPIPLSYCVGIPNCLERAFDVVRLEANADCNSCPDSRLSECCSFRYEDAINTRELMLSRPEIYQASPLLQYIAGILPYKKIPANKKTFYCLGPDSSSGCSNPSTCTSPVQEKNRTYVTSSLVTRFTLDELVESVGGRRNPPARKERHFRSAPIQIGQRAPSEAEMVFWTQFWRFQEQESKPWTRNFDASGRRRVPLVTWKYTTNGRSTMHSRLHGIPCGGGLQVQSCSNDRGVCDGFTCGKNAQCYPFDGRPLCVCNDGFWGDGTLCQRPRVSASYQLIYPYLWSAHELYFNGSTAEYYPDVSVKDWCYGDHVDWPARIPADRIAPYPGGLPKYALKGCGTKLCALSEQCIQGNCVQTARPTKAPTRSPTRKPTKKPSMKPTRYPTMGPTIPSSSASGSPVPSNRSNNAPSRSPTVFKANFQTVAKATLDSKKTCGCQPLNNTMTAMKSHRQCIQRIRNMSFRNDLQSGRVRKTDRDAWIRRFNRRLTTRCSM